jgi:xanthosine utilization system XapX-like protein
MFLEILEILGILGILVYPVILEALENLWDLEGLRHQVYQYQEDPMVLGLLEALGLRPSLSFP